MEFDLKKLGELLIKRGLMDKPFKDLNKIEIKWICEFVHEVTTEHSGFEPPYITKEETLIIPFIAPLKYRYWQGGQSIKETLEELNVPDRIKKKYTPTGAGEGMAKKAN